LLGYIFGRIEQNHDQIRQTKTDRTPLRHANPPGLHRAENSQLEEPKGSLLRRGYGGDGDVQCGSLRVPHTLCEFQAACTIFLTRGTNQTDVPQGSFPKISHRLSPIVRLLLSNQVPQRKILKLIQNSVKVYLVYVPRCTS